MKLETPTTRKKRKIKFEDYIKIQECLSDNYGVLIEKAGLPVIGSCLCFTGFSDRKDDATRKMLKELPGRVGVAFAKTTWNRLADYGIGKAKGLFVKRVVKKLPNSLKNKYINKAVDDLYKIFFNELSTALSNTYKDKAKF